MDKAKTKKLFWQVARVVISLGILAWIFSHIQFQDVRWKVLSRTARADGRIDVKLVDAADAGKTKTLTVSPEQFTAEVGQDWQEQGFLTVCKRIQLGWLAGALGVFWLAPALQAMRWRRLLRVQGVRLSVATVLKLMWVGLFFNLFLIGAVGGDLVKAYYVSHHSPQSRAESVVTVLVDRIIGLLGLVWLSALSMVVWLVLRPGGGKIEGGLPWAWLLPGVVVLIMGAAFYSGPVRNVLGINRLIGRLGEDHMIRRLDRAVYVYRHHKGAILAAFGWTLASHICLMLTIHFVLRSLGIDALAQVLILAPLILVLTGLIPSIGGVGTQEIGFVLFFGPLVPGGEGVAVGFAASMVYRLTLVAWSLPGAGVMMIGTHLPSRAEMKRDMETT